MTVLFLYFFFFFYFYNLKNYRLKINNILFFILLSTFVLILNQIIKNLNSSLLFYILFTLSYLIIFITMLYYIQIKTSE